MHSRRALAVVALVLLAGCVTSLAPSDTADATDSTPPTLTAGESSLQVTVARVVDGDTIDIRYANGTEDTVRLLGIDTPEVFGTTSPGEFEGIPDDAAGAACLDAEAEDASAHLKDRLTGATVTLVFDDASDRRDRYDRLLAYVLHEGENINYHLVADGYARVYDTAFAQADRFYTAERTAQDAHNGVWRCRDPNAATTRTASESGLVVADIQADAPGNDNENLNEELLVFENAGNETLSLGDWQVSDDAGHTYRFPDDFSLAPGQSVTLHTGTGEDTATDLYWGRTGAVWNNGGDTITVTDADGTIVVQRTYE
jgi:micrococcal nuclease